MVVTKPTCLLPQAAPCKKAPDCIALRAPAIPPVCAIRAIALLAYTG